MFNNKHTKTNYIQLDTQKCKACWICIENCPNQIIKKINLPWHKHALIAAPDNCTGCFTCINFCPKDAYSKINTETMKIENNKTI